MFGQMNCELLPAAAYVSTEPTGLVTWVFGRLVPAILHQFPESCDLPVVLVLSLVFAAALLRFRLRHLVLADKMLDKVVLPVTRMTAVGHRTGPPLQLPVSLTLVSDPVRFALEGFRLVAALERASKRLHIFVDVLGPV